MELTVDEYLEKLAEDSTWADHLAVTATAQMLQYEFVPISKDSVHHVTPSEQNTYPKLCLGYVKEYHFCSTAPMDSPVSDGKYRPLFWFS